MNVKAINNENDGSEDYSIHGMLCLTFIITYFTKLNNKLLIGDFTYFES
jgi:hypothetical protein